MKKEHRNYKKKRRYFCVVFGFVIPLFFLLLLGPVAVQAASLGDMVINEILYDPANNPTGDANYDGTYSIIEDEFVEIVNITESAIDMTFWSLRDEAGERHLFPLGTIIDPGHAIVVFGGGSPLESVWNNTTVQTASTGTLELSNAGDTITLRDIVGVTIWEYSYTHAGAFDESVNLYPELSTTFPVTTMVPHSTIHVNGDLFSPGFTLNGEEFGSSPVPEPATMLLLGSGVIFLAAFKRRFRKS